MKWANFLHIYQPANQADDIFERVVKESYRPILQSLKDNPTARLTLNINAALSEQFVSKGYTDVIEDIKFVAKRGQIEFTGSAMYHTLLPFLPEEEIRRQIDLNLKTNQDIFGADVYNPVGFFPPEMAYSPKIAPIIESMGYKWIIMDEIGLNGRVNQVDTTKIYTIKGTNLNVFFRERIPSNLIMSALIREKKDFQDLWHDLDTTSRYMITGMDGETFGHHRPGLQKLLTGLMTSEEFEHVFMGELLQQISIREVVDPIVCTWASAEKDIEEGQQFLTWNDNTNKIHALQWELFHLALNSVHEYQANHKDDAEGINDARHKLDQGLASDLFFWASARPWWSVEVIEAGSWLLLDTISSIPNISEDVRAKAEKLYHDIVATAFEWQRTGYIKNIYAQYKQNARIPFKERTIGKGEPWVYTAFIELMRNTMQEAAQKENFEEATLWRDAIWKLETKNDIYDAVHAVDMLRTRVDNGAIMDMIAKYRREYERLSSGQPEQRS